MSTPQSPENQNPRPYRDPARDAQDNIPGQGAWNQGGQGDQGGYQQAGYSQQGYQQADYAQQGGYQQGGYQPGGYQQPGGYGGGHGGPRPTAYLEGAPVGFGDAVREAFRHPLTLRGRASRSAFWWFQLLAVIAYAVVSVISNQSTVAGVILDIIIGIPFIVTNISLAVRRLHDSNHTGWWWWIGFVPLVGWIISIVFYLLPGTPGPNRYSGAR